MSLVKTTARRSFMSSQLQILRLFPAVPSYGIHSSAATRAAQQQQSKFPKKQISLKTIDPSNKKWAELSRSQKAVRTASTGVNAAAILLGLAVTVGASSTTSALQSPTAVVSGLAVGGSSGDVLFAERGAENRPAGWLSLSLRPSRSGIDLLTSRGRRTALCAVCRVAIAGSGVHVCLP